VSGRWQTYIDVGHRVETVEHDAGHSLAIPPRGKRVRQLV
jgi:hypothetical protein